MWIGLFAEHNRDSYLMFKSNTLLPETRCFNYIDDTLAKFTNLALVAW